MSYCNILTAVQFVQRYSNDCAVLAKMLNVPVENVLGLAAHESQHGIGRIAVEDNNYFSMHAPAPLQIGEDVARKDPHVRVAKFSSFLQSGQSFVARYGQAVKGKADPREFAQALVRVHFNTGNPKTGGAANYAQKVVDAIAMVKLRMVCQ
ncbi:glucosaminidase domain-containing protein [Pseudomonas sp. P9_31]|uniref:glucosaminidase domain-containing protein n=1 Tax=Pseudomonas sp. P9_31 TaxID=3043448 RepID=UPI002A3632AA|nr:glucosaminidase domain-containing protein [Pseudomonas sp. P9_31]WPN58595.1 hypothetical protein QMK51_02870 [Pseudomonas sp. P9_31]